MKDKIGQSPYEFPTIFSFLFPEYIDANDGPTVPASLVSPESALLTLPNTLQLLSGMFSLVKYGLSSCDSGFSTDPGLDSECLDDGKYGRSYGGYVCSHYLCS